MIKITWATITNVLTFFTGVTLGSNAIKNKNSTNLIAGIILTVGSILSLNFILK